MKVFAKLLCGTLLAGALAGPGWAENAATESTAAQLRQLAALVDYLAADYPGAVKGGAIVSASEYEEQRGMLSEARRLAAAVAPRSGRENGPLTAGLDRLEKDFLAKADSRTIAADGVAIHLRLVGDYGLVLTPLAPPDLTRAKAVYQATCASCHGKQGRADTVQARTLKPPPVSFFDGARLSRISPALAFNAITLGVANTAMASFETLPASDRWSLAFYVVSLRHSRNEAARGAALVRRSGLPMTASLSRLSGLSDLDLDGLLRGAEPSGSNRAAIVSYLRQAGSFDAGSSGPFDEARRLLAEVARAAGEAKAHDLAVQAYLDGIEPQEAALTDRDRGLAGHLEHEFAELRRLIDGGAAAAAVRDQVGRALLVLDQAEERILTARKNRRVPVRAGGPPKTATADQAPPSLGDTSCGAWQDGFAPGPALRTSPGMVEFAVFKSCLFPRGKGLAVAVSLLHPPPSRERVSALVSDLYRQARHALGKNLPAAVQICAFAPGTTLWSADYLACEMEGFEPPGEEPDEIGPELTNRTPYSLAEEAEKLLQDRSAHFTGKRRMQIRVDQRTRELTVTYPYLEPGKDAFASGLTYAGAVQPFFSIAGDFYTSSVPEPRKLTFVGTWNGETVLRVRLEGEQEFRVLDQWPMLERLHRAGISDDPRARTPGQETTVREEYERALARLPRQSWKVAARLRGHD